MANQWNYTRLTGNKGESGDGLSVQYSQTSTGSWHTAFTTGDLYMRQSTDGGTTWSDAMRIVGEQGEPGTAGHSPVVTATKSGTTTTIKVDGVTQATVNDGSAGSPGANALQPKQEFASQYTTVGQTASWATSNFNRTPVVGDTFLNVDAGSNLGTWQITAVSNGTATFKLLSVMSIANGTFIANLFSQFIKIGTGGAIYGGDRYTESGGYAGAWGKKNGFYLAADGTFRGRLMAEFGSFFVGEGAGNARNGSQVYRGNIGILEDALKSLTVGINNIALGWLSQENLTTGSHNITLGYYSGQGLTTGKNNIGIGPQTLYDNQTGSHNIALGNLASNNKNSSYDIIIGDNASSSVNDSASTAGNIVIGKTAAVLSSVISKGNICIGPNARAGTSTNEEFSGNVVIGAGASVTGASNGATDCILIGTDTRIPTMGSATSTLNWNELINIGNVFTAAWFRWYEANYTSYKMLQSYSNTSSDKRDYSSNISNDNLKEGRVACLPDNTFIGSGTADSNYGKVIGVKSYYFSPSKSYIKFTNGLIIQWGVAPGYNGAQTITFPLNFTSESSYAVTAILYGSASNCACITTRNKSSFACDFAYGVSSGAKGGPWIAIGY